MTTKFSRRNLLAAGVVAGTAAGTSLITRPAAAEAGAAEPGAATSGAASPGVAFTHVTVIDPHLGQVWHDMTVVVRGETITAVGPSGQVRVPAGSTVVDLRGRFLIPGLADMHTHGYFEQIDPALCVANGVTTVREMSGVAEVHDWRRKVEAGTLLGPRYAISSRIIDGTPSIWDPAYLDVIQVADAAQARQAVRQVVAEGADFVKVYSRLPPAALRAIAGEARRLGIAFAGHCPDQVPVAEAAKLGQASIEHMFWTAYDTSSEEARIRAQIARIRLELGDYGGWFKAIHPLEWTAVHTYSPAKARQVFGTFAERRTRQVPTLVLHYGVDYARTLNLDDPRAKYLPPSARAVQELSLQEFYLKDRAPAEDAEWAAMFDHRLRMVGEMHRAGVPIMTGTDTISAGVFPGFSVHDELRFLVEAGLSPMAALHAATAEPAAFLGLKTGRVAAGHAADLVVLGADPLRDIGNSQRIDGVVVRGRYVDAAERIRILRGVEEAAASMPAEMVAAAACACHG